LEELSRNCRIFPVAAATTKVAVVLNRMTMFRTDPGVRRRTGRWVALAIELLGAVNLSIVIPGFIPGIQLEAGEAGLKARGTGKL
jgi:hypothetical protein